MGLRTDKTDKQNLEHNFLNQLYPTQHNTSNRFSLIKTPDDDEDDEKTSIISNQTPNNMETEYYTSIMKITNKEAITNAGEMGNFVPPGTPVNNVQSEIKPISFNIPDG